jgi:hypothetical protein
VPRGWTLTIVPWVSCPLPRLWGTPVSRPFPFELPTTAPPHPPTTKCSLALLTPFPPPPSLLYAQLRGIVLAPDKFISFTLSIGANLPTRSSKLFAIAGGEPPAIVHSCWYLLLRHHTASGGVCLAFSSFTFSHRVTLCLRLGFGRVSTRFATLAVIFDLSHHGACPHGTSQCGCAMAVMLTNTLQKI